MENETTDQSAATQGSTATTAAGDQTTKTTEAPSNSLLAEAVNKQEKAAPEKYEFKSPKEGVELDKNMLEAFEPVAKDLDLSQEGAQKLVDLYHNMRTAEAERETEMINKQVETWQKELKSQPDIDITLQRAAKVISLGDENIREMFNGPYGSHPAVIKWLAKVGEAISEHKFVQGEDAIVAQGPKAIYKNSPELK